MHYISVGNKELRDFSDRIVDVSISQQTAFTFEQPCFTASVHNGGL